MKKGISLAIFLVSLIVQSVLALKPDSVYHYRPENAAMIYKEMDIETPDGYKIKTWFFPAQDIIEDNSLRAYFYDHPLHRPYKTCTDKPLPTVIVCDGDAVNMSGSVVYVRCLVTHGYNVVTFDWRGFGQSSPFPMDQDFLCYTEFLTDYHAVVDSVARMKEVDPENIAVFGPSTGAYLSMAVAYTNDHVKCFAGRGLMTSFDDFLTNHSRWATDNRQIKKPTDYPEELYPIRIAPHFKKPAFLIVGGKDVRTPVEMSEAIFEKLPDEKLLWVVPEAEHGGPRGPEFVDIDRFERMLVNFLDIHLKR